MLDKHGFDRWAGSYDNDLANRLNAFPFIGYYEVLAVLLARTDPAAGQRVLDVGIGTGLLAEEFSRKGCRIYGVDFSTQMLERARARIPGANLAPVDVAKHHLGEFSDQRFDRIVSAYFFHHLAPEHQLEFLRQAIRDNLTANGRIVIADVGFETEEAFEAAHREYETAWDEAEFYLCGENLVTRLRNESIEAHYEQVSACAGILSCTG